MKIKEIVAMSMEKTIAAIAKDHLTIGEKPLRTALKAIGCEHQNGKKGWHYVGDIPGVLEQSVYDFVQPIHRKAKANVPTYTLKEPIDVNNQRSNVTENSSKKEVTQANRQAISTKEPSIERTNVIRKRSSFDLDVELMKELKIQAIIHDRTVYEIVEMSVRKYLKELKKGK